MAEKKFEEKMKELESIVSVLQKGDISLDDSIKQFEKGAKLVAECKSELDQAEQKVSLLLYGKDGPVKEPFNSED